MADDIMEMCDKEYRQHMQYGRQDGKAMKGKILTGMGLLLIAAALLITVYNIMNPIVIPENNVTCYYRK